MRKLGRPEGLIRYGSQNGFAGAARHMFRPRVVIYPLIVTLCLTVFGVLLANRGDAMIVQKRMQAAPAMAATAEERRTPSLGMV